MMTKKVPKENNINKNLMIWDWWLVVGLIILFAMSNNTKLIQKNPQSTAIIQIGEIWQLPFSKIKGPNFAILTKKSGAQLTPIPETKGEKWEENGKENSIKENISKIAFTKKPTEIL